MRSRCPRTPRCTAFLSVMEGCSKACSYCIVPHTRGKEISRPLDDVLAEAERLAELGAREITLLGQNVNAYRGAAPGGGKADLADADPARGRDRLASSASASRRRIPRSSTTALIDAYATVDKLASYLHLPVQSGSDRVLKLMKRGYTAGKYLAKIEKLKRARPGISISTRFHRRLSRARRRQDFEATLELIRAVGFDQSFSFIYSPRPGTPAAELERSAVRGQATAPRAPAGARVNEQAAAISLRMVGTVQRILVERESRRGGARARGHAPRTTAGSTSSASRA